MRTQTGAMPGWVKVALVFVALVIVGLIGLVVFLCSTIKRDPVAVQKVLNSIVTFKKPLPDSFRYLLAMDTPQTRFAILQHDPDQLQIVIGWMTVTGRKLEPDDLINQIAQASGKGRHKFKEESKGEEMIAGKKLEYVLGRVDTSEGKESSAMIGYFPPDSAGRMDFVFGLTASGTYNMPTTDEVLHDIDSIQ